VVAVLGEEMAQTMLVVEIMELVVAEIVAMALKVHVALSGPAMHANFHQQEQQMNNIM
jgi:hypothetical protein